MKTNPFIAHLTLNTGDVRQSPRAEVPDSVIELLRPLVQHGGGPIPNTQWHCFMSFTDGGSCFDIRLNPDHQALMCGVAWTPQGSDEVWRGIEDLYHKTTESMLRAGCRLPESELAMPEQPSTLPWLGVVLLPGIYLATASSDLFWMADFERCLAWTLIESAKGPARLPKQ